MDFICNNLNEKWLVYESYIEFFIFLFGGLIRRRLFTIIIENVKCVLNILNKNIMGKSFRLLVIVI